MKKITVGCLGIAVLLGGVTYVAKQKVISLEEELSQINRQILVKRESELILRAEWSHLSRPSRVQELAESHLDMNPIEGWQVVSLKNVVPDERGHLLKGKGPVRLASAKSKTR